MTKTQNVPRASLLVRGLPAEVKTALQIAAANNNRSLNGEIVHRLTQSVKEEA